MKNVLPKYRISWFVGFCLAGILAIVVCNLCLLYFGHCVVGDFLNIPPIGWFVIAANLVAGAALALIKQGGRQRSAANHCPTCNVGLRDVWVYCPNCGEHAAHRPRTIETRQQRTIA
jgi:predicted RNA-binding Zn-ribbon protein involved in translation (DUF1610 family)